MKKVKPQKTPSFSQQKQVPKKVINGNKLKKKLSVPKKPSAKIRTVYPVKNKGKVTNKLKLLIKLTGKWYQFLKKNELSQFVTETEDKDEKPLTTGELSSILSKAEKLLNDDIQAYKFESMRGKNKADYGWMDKIMKTGTLPDKMAAYTIRIQDSPVHNLYCLQQLIGMVKVQGKQQCLIAADTAKDLFLEDLLPQEKKLILFEQRGVQLRKASNKELILWLFEDKLKSQYRSFVDVLSRMSSDTIEKLRGKAITIIYQLLSTHPEQEQILLPLLVNKLGDPIKKIASRALFHLNKLLEQHPQMKMIVVQEVERLLFRNNVGKKAQYYGICFLNTIRVLGDESSVAIKLVKVYLAFFKACIKTGEIDSKMMSGLLTGVNKAFPIAKMDGFEFTESLDTLYKIVQLSQFNIGIQALALLFQLTNADKNSKEADRYYRVLYKKLLSPEVATTSHGMQLLNVVFKAMKTDNNHNRIIAFSKRLLQLCNHMPPNLACAMLFLISEVSKAHQDIVLLGKSSVTVKEMSETDDEISEDESNKTMKKPQVDVKSLLKKTNITFDSPKEDAVPPPQSSNKIEADVVADDVVEIKEEKHRNRIDYDPMARNPAYCGAEQTLSYELTSLSQHFHPSVAMFSNTLLNKQFIKYDGNPLKDFTVGRFLERFVYRNAKQKRVHQQYQPQGLRNLPVNSSEYLQTVEDKIPIEERFFYKFFKEQKSKKEKVDEEDESDVESVNDEEFDEFMDNYFKSNKEKGSDEEEDEDVDFVTEMKTKVKGKKRKVEEEESEDDDDDEEEAIDFDEDADELIDLDDMGEEMEMDDEDDFGEEDFEEFGGQSFKQKLKLKTQKLKRKSNKDDMFAPAEEFAEMLESNADMAFSSSNTLINKDNSNAKQLKWETERDRWVKGYRGHNSKKFNAHKGKKRKM